MKLAPWLALALPLGCYAPRPSIEPDGGSCAIAPTITQVFSPDAGPSRNHVPEGTVIQYASNPPAGGDHYPVWATWGVHTDAVPDGYFVHNEEHGGVVLLYNCPTGCPAVVAALAALVSDQPADPLCTVMNSGVNARVLLTPDPSLEVPVAAAAWGWTYTQPEACVDAASLQAFITAHLGQGPEDFCSQGSYD